MNARRNGPGFGSNIAAALAQGLALGICAVVADEDVSNRFDGEDFFLVVKSHVVRFKKALLTQEAYTLSLKPIKEAYLSLEFNPSP